MIKIIDFYAEWCGPCKIFSPLFDKVSEEYKSDTVEFLKIDVEENREMAIEHQVSAMPTLLILENDKEIFRNVGLMSEQALRQIIVDNIKA